MLTCDKCGGESPAGAKHCGSCGAALPAGASTRDMPATDPFEGRYHIVTELGRGGMGIVFEAEQQNPRRAVALKVIRGGAFVDESHLRMFQREVQVLARLKHPGIAAIYESGRTADGQPYFAMELIHGETLDAYLTQQGDRSREGIHARLDLFIQICEAVTYAHQRGIIHRDLKPANILVPRVDPQTGLGASGMPGVKILDFGLARITDPDAAECTLVTQQGQVQGTFPYISPEQVRGDPDAIDLRTDVYALGAILYEMLAGSPPHVVSGISVHEAARIVCEEPPRPFAAAADLKTIVLKALDKDPDRRYDSVAALAADVERYRGRQPILARPPSLVYQLRKMVSRHKLVFGFVLVLGVLLTGLAVTLVVYSARVAAERDRAASEAAKAQAINRFLLETLGSANPVEGSGRDVTVLEALDQVTPKIADSFAEQPDVEADVRFTIGHTYLRLGRYDEAEQLFTEAARAAELAYGPGHEELADPINALALIKHERGALGEAEAMYRRALEIARAIHGEDHPDVLGILNNLALLLQEKGDLAGAEPLMRRILEADRRAQGPEHLHVGMDMSNLGKILLLRGKYAEAEEQLRGSVALLRKLENPGLSICLGNLGELLHLRGDAEAAEPVLAEAVRLGREKFGDESQDVAKIRVKYGACLLTLGRLPAAEEHLLAGLAVLEKSAGENNRHTQQALETLAKIYAARGDEGTASKYRARIKEASE